MLEQQPQRKFHAEICRLERRSVRTHRQRIDFALYERSAISRKPEAPIAIEQVRKQFHEQIEMNHGNAQPEPSRHRLYLLSRPLSALPFETCCPT
jgi:predicted nuclease of restriction endonuclease-like (RecB) superfamily